jgi:hypothetical protein
MTTVQTVFAALLGVAALVTVVGYPRKYGALSGRSRLFRTLGVLLIDLLLVLLLAYFSTDFKAIPDARVAAVRGGIYLISFVLITFSLVGLALLDTLESVVVYRRERRAAVEQMIREEVAHIQQKREQQAQTPDQPAPGAGPAHG